MTQDAQKFTDGDLKKAKVLFDKFVEAGMVCDQEERDIVPPIAQALRDERKGLEDRVRELESALSKVTDDDFLEYHLALEANIKALEAENEALKKDIDVMASGMARYVEDNARLKAEVERVKEYCDSPGKFINRQEKQIVTLEARLAEAVRVLKIYSDINNWLDLPSENEVGTRFDYKDQMGNILAWKFLQSPTNSEAQERQKPQITIDASLAKTFLRSCLDENPTPQEPVYIKEHKEVLPFMKNIKAGDLDPEARCIQWSCRCGYQNFNQVCNKCNSLKADSEARGGCEHDKGTYWVNQKPSTWVYEKSEYPKCPTCDKKTGVRNES